MFSLFPFEPDRRFRQLESRENARRLARGQISSPSRGAAATRADLPDVDVSRVTYLPRRSFLQGLAALLGLRSVILAPTVSGAGVASSGETHSGAYLHATSTEHTVSSEPRLAA
ncbi:hypothetical protein [Tianweitania sediminis]|uniref:Uncharacterized protein n=1 Tax=Tianweitania sediminis TaxID=1502156 RepID=A0A8J7QZ11_9HYPH|nr:hypothetical protein [Tianweitania sediminis]MBP0439373.1 hypothetical protein [Tianweitania sediminis]